MRIIFLVLSLVILKASCFQNEGSMSTYTCVNKTCQRTLKEESVTGVPITVCKLNCGDHGSLLPLPSGDIQLGGISVIDRRNVTIDGYEGYPTEVMELFVGASEIFQGYLDIMNPNGWNPVSDPVFENHTLSIHISVMDNTLRILTLATDESYTLTINRAPESTRIEVNIEAANFYGARHGLETLSQLIAFDEDIIGLQVVNNVTIVDKPAYPYRGVLIDTSRNFISLSGLMRLIDGLSFHKMNIFHWHITDTHSFPMEVEGNPEFHNYGAYSPEEFYSIEQMKALVEYARVRGVKIVPEFDEPAHTGFGWEWGPSAQLGNLVVCLDQQPWYDFCVEPPCGQLNIANENMFNVLGNVFQSMMNIFDHDLFHMGGDEVDFRCYNSSIEITDYMAANNYTRDVEGFVDLWGYFQTRAHEKLVEASNNSNIQSLLWTSELTSKEFVEQHLNKDDYIIQIWTDVNSEMIPDLINAGYRTILSNYDALYLDCGFHAWIGNGHNWCSPYKTWQIIYENNPISIYAEKTNQTVADEAFQSGLFVGASAPLWMEQADTLSFENRVWPRASALAERLWTNPQTGWEQALTRMVNNRQRIVQRGINADRIQPEYCNQYEDHCYGPPASDPEEDEKPPNAAPFNVGATMTFLFLALVTYFFAN